jgi:hypothetical protein
LKKNSENLNISENNIISVEEAAKVSTRYSKLMPREWLQRA